jgi:hypothetical protein
VEPAAPPVAIPGPAQLLTGLRQEHPRLLASSNDFVRLKVQIAENKLLKTWHAKVREQGQHLFNELPSKYEIPDGLRLLSTSRRVLGRVYTLALLYRLEGDPRYAGRAWFELDAAANFPDWNPKHFLDTAEMTHAFAIGYDWLFDVWTKEQRARLRTAMVELGLKPAIKVHDEARWWAKARHNWNQVCNGGIGMGALALADVEPELAGKFLHAALQSLQLAMVEYGPDGAWAEGPGYWNYATTYNVTFLAALQTALGSDFGLAKIPGFADAGLFPIYVTGPLGRTFNYADGGDGTIRSASLFWLARQFDRPAYAWYERDVAAPHPLDLLWFDPRGETPTPATLPLDKHFRRADVVTFRSAWADRDAVFVGFKGGDNKANHSNLDLGTFVLDALGARWALDLGADNYNLPGYFGNKRWTYYRLRAEGHNTLVLNPGEEPDQAPGAAAPIVRFASKPERAFAIADLTAAYARHASKVERGLALLERQRVLVQDEIAAKTPAELWWFMHTPATIRVGASGTVATLVQGRERLFARILAPDDARFAVRETAPLPSSPQPERQGQNRDVRKLAIHLKDVSNVRLAVLFTPLRGTEVPDGRPPTLAPLAQW